jgi:hypothetical protein
MGRSEFIEWMGVVHGGEMFLADSLPLIRGGLGWGQIKVLLSFPP